MNPFPAIGRFLLRIGSLIGRAVTSAAVRGLKDKLVTKALLFVRQAAANFPDNMERREWVVALLVREGVPESLARLAVELAVQLYKDERQTETVPETAA